MIVRHAVAPKSSEGEASVLSNFDGFVPHNTYYQPQWKSGVRGKIMLMSGATSVVGQ